MVPCLTGHSSGRCNRGSSLTQVSRFLNATHDTEQHFKFKNSPARWNVTTPLSSSPLGSLNEKYK